MELIKGLKFTGKWSKGDCVIDLIDEELNDLKVLITSEHGQTRQEHWNLQHTIWGFENGDYTETPIQICYKTNEPCKFDCKGLCRESF